MSTLSLAARMDLDASPFRRELEAASRDLSRVTTTVVRPPAGGDALADLRAQLANTRQELDKLGALEREAKQRQSSAQVIPPGLRQGAFALAGFAGAQLARQMAEAAGSGRLLENALTGVGASLMVLGPVGAGVGATLMIGAQAMAFFRERSETTKQTLSQLTTETNAALRSLRELKFGPDDAMGKFAKNVEQMRRDAALTQDLLEGAARAMRGEARADQQASTAAFRGRRADLDAEEARAMAANAAAAERARNEAEHGLRLTAVRPLQVPTDAMARTGLFIAGRGQAEGEHARATADHTRRAAATLERIEAKLSRTTPAAAVWGT